MRHGADERARELLVDVIDLQQEMKQMASGFVDVESATAWKRADNALNSLSDMLLREIEANKPKLSRFWRSYKRREICLKGQILPSLEGAKIEALETNYEWLARAIERAISIAKMPKSGGARCGAQSFDERLRQLLKGMSAVSQIAQVELTLKLDTYELMFQSAAMLPNRDEKIFSQTWERVFTPLERAEEAYHLVVGVLTGDEFERIPVLVRSFDDEIQTVKNLLALLSQTIRYRDVFVKQIEAAQVLVSETLAAAKQQYESVGVGQKARFKVPDASKAFVELFTEGEQRLAQTRSNLAMAQTLFRLGDLLTVWAYFDRMHGLIEQLVLFSQEILRVVIKVNRDS